MNYFPWIKLISVLIHTKYRYYNTPSLELPFLSGHLCQISPWLTETLLQHNPHECFSSVSLFYLTLFEQKPQLLDIANHMPSQGNRIFIKLYVNHATLLIKHTTYQKAESFRTASLLKLENTENNNSIFNTKCADFPTKW